MPLCYPVPTSHCPQTLAPLPRLLLGLHHTYPWEKQAACTAPEIELTTCAQSQPTPGDPRSGFLECSEGCYGEWGCLLEQNFLLPVEVTIQSNSVKPQASPSPLSSFLQRCLQIQAKKFPFLTSILLPSLQGL